MPAAARSAQTHSRPHAGGSAATTPQSKPPLYKARHPERTLLYQAITEHFETWRALACCGQFDGQGDHHTPKPYVRQAFRKYLEKVAFDPVFGARPLRRAIQQRMENPLSKLQLEGRFMPKDVIPVDVDPICSPGQFSFERVVQSGLIFGACRPILGAPARPG